MNAKKWLYLLIALILTICVSAASWLFLWDGLPKKTPLRARQVLLLFPVPAAVLLDTEPGLRIKLVMPVQNIAVLDRLNKQGRQDNGCKSD